MISLRTPAPGQAARDSERGNVLFYILIAVGLIALLAYAISDGQRGNTSDLEESRARIVAGELVEVSNIYANAVAQLRLRGVADSDLCFDDPAWEDYENEEDYAFQSCGDRANRLYHPEGAGIVWGRLPIDAFDSAQMDQHNNLFHFISDNEIQDVGTTCGREGCADLLNLIDGLRKSVCIKINDLVGVENRVNTFDENITDPPREGRYGTERFRGRYDATETLGDESDAQSLRGKLSGCFESRGQDNYVFYRVLVAR